ncbi:classical arabinogalactan protein 4-like [Panicum hallii]|uniref:classical arabinogalactan protein 4-like n=1 Tax=Panicum hallii TaxID=206008 RepID=UPI000DF4D61A|nr:classical arabinogalactan protein 4-like [Panicum hallii]
MRWANKNIESGSKQVYAHIVEEIKTSARAFCPRSLPLAPLLSPPPPRAPPPATQPQAASPRHPPPPPPATRRRRDRGPILRRVATGLPASPTAALSPDLNGFAAALGGAPGFWPGILSPAALPLAASTGLFSPMLFDPSCLSWLGELSPFHPSAGTRAEQAPPFAPSPRSSLLLATPTMPLPPSLCARVLQQGQQSKGRGWDNC